MFRKLQIYRWFANPWYARCHPWQSICHERTVRKGGKAVDKRRPQIAVPAYHESEEGSNRRCKELETLAQWADFLELLEGVYSALNRVFLYYWV